ncbi:MAG: helix-turn-helix domain-containing protein [Pseudomonadaceae bacterium]
MPPDSSWLSPAVHPVYSRLVHAELRRLGHSPEQIRNACNVDWDAVQQANQFLSLEYLTKLLEGAITLTGHPGLGFAVGMHTDVSAHGPGGYAAVTAPTIGAAVDTVEHYANLRQHLAHFVIEQTEPPVLRLEEEQMPAQAREYLLGHFATAMLRLLETASGLALQQEITIEWPLPRPEWADEVADFAGTWIFDSDAMRLRLPAGLFDMACLAADPDIHRQALRDCEHQLQHQRRGGDLSERIKKRLLSCEYRYPTLAQMAELEHMTPRTLIRHLGNEGMRFQQLLDDVRSEQACWLLEHTELSVELIAERLGYQDTSNFSRTFRRWLGCPPRAYRQRSQATS